MIFDWWIIWEIFLFFLLSFIGKLDYNTIALQEEITSIIEGNGEVNTITNAEEVVVLALREAGNLSAAT